MEQISDVDFFNVESSLWVAARKTNVPAYDFEFYPLFVVNRPSVHVSVPAIARIGAIDNYDKLYELCSNKGFELINNPVQHSLASELARWYPLISDMTPKSKVYQRFPSLEEVQKDFAFPIFIKGNRQTAMHNSRLSVAYNENDWKRISLEYMQNPILHWQNIVCRAFVSLKEIGQAAPGKLPLSYEFRSFWWKGRLVGVGHYWSQFATYDWSTAEKEKAIALAAIAAEKIQVPFLVIDLALTVEGNWIIIECNDAQESGYCGVNKAGLWRNIIFAEQNVAK